jgi:GntR family transcriptional regulator
LPAALFRGFTKARYDAYRGSMYSFFEAEFGVRMLKAQERIRAVGADAATRRYWAPRRARRCWRWTA